MYSYITYGKESFVIKASLNFYSFYKYQVIRFLPLLSFCLLNFKKSSEKLGKNVTKKLIFIPESKISINILRHNMRV